jgi:hypothetical protein
LKSTSGFLIASLTSPHARSQRETNNRFDEFVTARFRSVEKKRFLTGLQSAFTLLGGRFEVQIV